MIKSLNFTIIEGLKTFKIPKDVVDEMFRIADSVAINTFPLPNKVSCAVLTKDGTIYPGAEYRTDILALSMHAEAVAISNAATHGEPDIIAITGQPCNACRQMLWENAMRSGNNIMIFIKKNSKGVPLSSMVSYPWPENHWKKK